MVLDTTVERREAQTRTVDNVEQLRTLPKGVMRAAVKVDGVDGEGRYFERHVNRNGDLGGFVEDTAYAGKDTYVGAKALVLEKARMTDHSMIYGTTTLCEGAALQDDARFYSDGGIMRGWSRGFGDAHIAEWVLLEGNINVGGHVHVYGIDNERRTVLGGQGSLTGHMWIYDGINWRNEEDVVESDEHFGTQEQVDAFLSKLKNDKLVKGQEQIAGLVRHGQHQDMGGQSM